MAKSPAPKGKAAPAAKPTIGARLAADPALRAKYLKNPGLRSLLPDSLLSPAQLASRKTNAYNKAPITDGSTVTNAQLGREATNYQTAQFAPQRQDLATQQSAAVQHTSDVAGWYDQYQRELAQHFSNVQQAGQQAITADQQLASGVKALDNTQAAQSQQAAQTDAAYRGGTVDPSMAQTANNASLVRQQMLAATSGAQASTNAANSVYADTLAHVVAPGQGVVAKQRASDKVGAVADAMKALSAQEGGSKADYMTKRTTDERNYVLSQQALGLNVAKANTTAKTDAARIDIARGVDPVTGKPIVKPKSASDAKTAGDVAFFKQHGYYPPTGPPKTAKPKVVKPTTGPGSLTPVAEDKKVSQAKKVAQALMNPTKQLTDPITGAKRTVPATPTEVLANLKAQAVDPDVLAIGTSLYHNNGTALGPNGVAAAHRAGIHVGGRWKVVTDKPKAKKGPVLPPATSSVGSKPPVKLGG